MVGVAYTWLIRIIIDTGLHFAFLTKFIPDMWLSIRKEKIHYILIFITTFSLVLMGIRDSIVEFHLIINTIFSIGYLVASDAFWLNKKEKDVLLNIIRLK